MFLYLLDCDAYIMSSSMEDVDELGARKYLELLLLVLRDEPVTRIEPMTDNLDVTRALASLLEQRGFYLQAVCQWSGDQWKPISWNVHAIGCKCKGTYCFMGFAAMLVGSSNQRIIGSKVPAVSLPYSPAVRSPPQASGPYTRGPEDIHPAWGYLGDSRASDQIPNVDSKAEVDKCLGVIDVFRRSVGDRKPISMQPMTKNMNVTWQLAAQVEQRGMYLHAIFVSGGDKPMYPIRWNIHEIGCLCLGEFCVMGVAAGLSHKIGRFTVGSKVPVVKLDLRSGAFDTADNRITERLLLEPDVDKRWFHLPFDESWFGCLLLHAKTAAWKQVSIKPLTDDRLLSLGLVDQMSEKGYYFKATYQGSTPVKWEFHEKACRCNTTGCALAAVKKGPSH